MGVGCVGRLLGVLEAGVDWTGQRVRGGELVVHVRFRQAVSGR